MEQPRRPLPQDFGCDSAEARHARLFRRAWLAIIFPTLAVHFFSFFAIGLYLEDIGSDLAYLFFLPAFPLCFATIWASGTVTKALVRLYCRRYPLSTEQQAQAKVRYDEALRQYKADERAWAKALYDKERSRQLAQRYQERARAQAAEEEAERLAQIKAEEDAAKRQVEFWYSLSGVQFENEVAELCETEGGYEVRKTPVSGDEGIDLWLEKDGVTSVAQCKAHDRPIGPRVTRELYGTMKAVNGEVEGILITLAGVTQGAREFIKGKSITVWDVNDLIKIKSGRKLVDVETHTD